MQYKVQLTLCFPKEVLDNNQKNCWYKTWALDQQKSLRSTIYVAQNLPRLLWKMHNDIPSDIKQIVAAQR